MREVIIAIIGSGALSAAVSGIIALINGSRKAKAGVDKALCFLILGDLERQFDKLTAKGYATRNDAKRFHEVYGIYKTLDGDGYADDMLEAVKDMSIK